MGWGVRGVSSLPREERGAVRQSPGRLPPCRHVPASTPFAGTPASTPSLPAPPCRHPGSGDRRGVPPRSLCAVGVGGRSPAGGTAPLPGPQGRQLRALQPCVLSYCYSVDGSVVAETFQVLRGLVDQLPWQHSAAFLIQLTFTLAPFLEEVRAPRPVSLLGRLPVTGWPELSQGPSGQTVMPAMGLTATAPGL